MLDEAANVCRIDALPDLYSFFGSQGISVTTILQSYKQGVRVWGRDGMDALWSAATVAIAGAAVRPHRAARGRQTLPIHVEHR